MQPLFRAVLGSVAMITVSVTLFIPVVNYTDPRYADYFWHCVLNKECPIIDLAPSSDGSSLRFEWCSVNGHEFVVMLRPGENFDTTCRPYLR